MTEQSNQLLTRAQLALAAAAKACQLRKETSRPPRDRDAVLVDEDRKANVVEETMCEFSDLQGITFIASLASGPFRQTEMSDDLPAVVDLAFRVRKGKGVTGGRLACSSELVEAQSLFNAGELVQSLIARLDENAIEYFLAWHVTGEAQVHLAHTRNSDQDAHFSLTDLILDEVWHALS